MQKCVYLIDVECNSRQNGIGTYIKTLVPVLKKHTEGVYLISMKSGAERFEIGKRLGCTDFRFPNSDYNDNASEYCTILARHIHDSPQTLFWINYTPCLEFVRVLKQIFPKSKLVATVHDQGWTVPLYGKKSLFKDIFAGGICPSIVSSRTFEYVRNYSSCEKELYELCDAVVALSESAKSTIVDIYKVKENKVFLIPNCIENLEYVIDVEYRENIRHTLGIGIEEKVICFAGRPVKSKGFETLLKAYALLRNKRNDVRLVVAGRLSDIATVENLFSSVAPWTTLLGLIPRQEVLKWYAVSDLGVIPSFTEQCSFTGIEMMAGRLLVVASNGYCVADMFKDGNNSLVAEIPENPLDTGKYAMNLCDVIEKALNMPHKEQKRLIETARDCFETNYLLEKFCKAYSELLKEI